MSIDLVLCATDLSLEEGAAWRSAARLVQALNARARILHVIEPVTFPYPAEGPGREELREKLRSDLLSEAREAVRARLASLEREWAEGYRADKIEAVTVLDGFAAQTILLEAERVAADISSSSTAVAARSADCSTNRSRNRWCPAPGSRCWFCRSLMRGLSR